MRGETGGVPKCYRQHGILVLDRLGLSLSSHNSSEKKVGLGFVKLMGAGGTHLGVI